MADPEVLHRALLAKIDETLTLDTWEDVIEERRLAPWTVLEQTGRAIFAERNGARYPLRAEVIERHIAEALGVDCG